MTGESQTAAAWETESRIGNASNNHQGNFKRVLCVCAAGLLRSPTAAWVLSQEPYNYNTRAAGVEASYALVGLDHVLLSWADEIVCMEPDHAERVEHLLSEVSGGKEKKLITLGIPDRFAYRDPELVLSIRHRYDEEVGHAQPPVLSGDCDE